MSRHLFFALLLASAVALAADKPKDLIRVHAAASAQIKNVRIISVNTTADCK